MLYLAVNDNDDICMEQTTLSTANGVCQINSRLKGLRFDQLIRRFPHCPDGHLPSNGLPQ